MGASAHGAELSKRYGTIEQRMDAETHPEPNSGCWLWAGAVDEFGYGRIRTGGRSKTRTHVLSYQRHVGPVPSGKVVRHRCDMPSCINPDHLIIGTHLDNVQDRVDRKRSARGVGHPLHKLTEDDVRAIRADKRSQREIAAAYGIASHTIIGRIKRREDWKHVA